ncbi:metallophosphoesterase family protein [Ferdinandcohnia quinoae]|uniref:Metallophosphatase family protein n=1 Tax=Fredinandcohnia quinoae TaxID=2918902 RepID=A0AAW5E0X8_9BACI|nr:metallophosphoesterase family protein [Fredinandcohnia sp. SECRCQ15]MCH1625229.1 metallophosphatase family protein [Fredinandcohnia sp. SECRCQ15]
MNSIAVISDIHGNMTALEAVIENINRRGIETIICLGDLIGKGPNPAAAVDCIREVCEVVVFGNWDEAVQKENEWEVMKWHQEQLGEERLAYLGTLPFHYDFYMSGKYIRLYHASAKSVHHRVVPMIHPMEEKKAMFENTEWISPLEEDRIPDVVGFGDIHAALIEPIGDQRTLFNVGSVGNPLDMTLATFAVLHGDYQSIKPAPFSIEIVRVPYDIEKEIQIAEQKEMPGLEPYAKELREAVYRGAFKES